MERFSVRIAGEEFSFSAAHFLAVSPRLCEPVHGHDYQVAVEIAGTLNEEHFVVDFVALRRALRPSHPAARGGRAAACGENRQRRDRGAGGRSPLGVSRGRLLFTAGGRHHGRAAGALAGRATRKVALGGRMLECVQAARGAERESRLHGGLGEGVLIDRFVAARFFPGSLCCGGPTARLLSVA